MTGHTLGLDLSLTGTGWATVTPDGGHRCGVIRTTTGTGNLAVRLDEIVSMAIKQAAGARLVVVEKPYNARFGNEPAIVYGAVIHGIYGAAPTVTVPPVSLKVFATGTGGGTKIGPAIQAAQRLNYTGADDNEVDALWLATLGWHLLDQPVVNLPNTHTRALQAPWAKPYPGHQPPPPKPPKRKKTRRSSHE